MKAKLVRIGNSRGLRLPKALIEQAALGEEVELELREDSIVISRFASPRRDWAEAASTLAQTVDDHFDPMVLTRFDRKVWEW
ncbi:MAG: AbrB/MazE/SpoVT family DNA-binding domain-containing protein [bacterium]